ncbi:MAG TPA: hypothetical protein VNL16_03935 [Chloroflexota bacterium]|nr:hypothetical protein [Chloroflexota bacterium]
MMGRFVLFSLVAAALVSLAACQAAPVATPAGPADAPTAAVVAGQATAVRSAPATSLPPTLSPTADPPTVTPLPPTATPVPPTSTPLPPTATPTPSQAVSWLGGTTLLGFYGRAFGVAPILGRLGFYSNADAMAKDVDTFSSEIHQVNGGKPVLPEIHLIYALAMPCSGNDDCLLYFESMDPHLVDDYIKPAQQRGWLVVLDTQLGRSDPVTQIDRMIAKGYLKYDNVEVALDPEFHVVPGHLEPGIPVGTITAQQVNDAQALLDSYVRKEHLAHRKILMVHQFGDKQIDDGVPFMIQDKTDVKDYPNVDLVVVADGFGGPDAKISKYNKMTDSEAYPFLHFRGIKLFPPNPYEHAFHYDRPLLTFRQVFGLDPTPQKQRVKVAPDVIIMN